jgi:SAM-dependent methyltransferase
MNPAVVSGRRELELVLRPCPTCDHGANRLFARGVDYEYRTCSNVFTFVQCERCSTVFLNPRPRREDLSLLYPATYYSTAEAEGRRGSGPLVRLAWSYVERRRARQLHGLLPDGPCRILDIGCGDGRLLKVLRKEGSPSWDLTGIEQELPPAALEQAARMGISLHAGLYEDLPFPPGHFHLVVAEQVIEHTLEPRAVLEKVHGELSPGGFAVFDMPDLRGLDRRLFSKSYWGGYHFPRHMTLFTPETFTTLARASGFEVRSSSHLASPVFWIMSLHNVGVGSGLPESVTSHVTYRSLPLLALATALEVPNISLLRQTSNMRMVLQKPLGGASTP